ncbi:MAG: hypothetical protein U0Q03_06420 [Acidimicrobiales bacterium]
MAVTLHPPAPVALRRRRSAPGAVVEAFLALTIVTAGVSLVAGAVSGRDHAPALAEAVEGRPGLDARDRAALGLAAEVHDFFGPGAAAAVVSRLADQVSADGARVTQVRLYPDRVFATARDLGDVLVDYTWVGGGLVPGGSRIDADATSSFLAFDPADVAWDRVADLVAAAPSLTGLASATVTHVTVDRSTLDPSLPVTIRIHVSGDRAGHPTNRLVEVAADGHVLRVA